MGDVERDLSLRTGASLRDRAGGPTDLSHSSVSQPKALIPSAAQLDRLWEKTGGKAWEPSAGLRHPFVAALIDGGWVKICTMRCGFEAFDTGLKWSDAAKAYFAARAASAMSASGQDAEERLEAKPASAVGAAETPDLTSDTRHDQ